MKTTPHSSRPRTWIRAAQAFTLIELIVVISILGILLMFSVPALTQAMQANKLTSLATAMSQNLAFAQQEAQNKNRAVQVRFFSYDDPSIPGPETKYRAYQFFQRAGTNLNATSQGNQDQLSNTLNPLGPIIRLSSPVVISDNPNFTSLINVGEHTGTIKWGKRGALQARFFAFDFLPSGATNLAGKQLWFLTLVEEQKEPRGGDSPPKNFATVQVDPFNGAVRVHRP